VRWTSNTDRLRHISARLLQGHFPWHALYVFVLSAVVFLVVFSWMSWLELELTPPVQIEADALTRADKEATGSSGSERSLSLQEYRRNIAGNIFGTEHKSDKEEKPEVSLQNIPLSEKDLHLELVGTIIGQEANQNIAVIEDTRTGDQEMYKPGDRIEQITIESVLRDNVVIKSSEGKKVLTMQYESLRQSRGRRGTGGGTTEQDQSGRESQNISKDYVLQSLRDMSKLMQSALIKPYLQDGETVGFQLDNIQSGSFYDRIGLKNKDVIMRVDGNDLNNPQQLMNFSKKLKNKDQVSLTVYSNGQKKEINYRLR